MSLRHFFIASSLILAPITTLGFGSAAFADTTTDIILSGTVDSEIAIDATPTTAAADLPLSPAAAGQDGSTTVRIADLDITSNNPAGITIEASSMNAGKLTSGEGENEILYTIAIVDNGAETPTSTTSVSSLNEDVNGFEFNAETGIKSMDLYIKYYVGGMPKQGTYSDTLTIIVSDN
ncbi:hypothetical protein [Planktothrix agardhii]|uniref:hypothetical protein n=1 Tax=Planktothrix agardhii TaxID=1160 RepID=UPI001D0AEB0A|nr:hypothetical protein [Planktothrix agardhii]MCB8750777.1 hypothetical protein [Planktothrix agardhii 1810]MCF3606583.1 hypothetical protein [Planktothrix agardhii 1033]